MAKSPAPKKAAPAAAKATPKAPGPAKATNGDGTPIKHLYLVDGSGYLFRAYHALPPMTRPDGTAINAVYGFCRMLAADLPQRGLRQVQGQPPAAARGPDPAIPADPRGGQGVQRHGV